MEDDSTACLHYRKVPYLLPDLITDREKARPKPSNPNLLIHGSGVVVFRHHPNEESMMNHISNRRRVRQRF